MKMKSKTCFDFYFSICYEWWSFFFLDISWPLFFSFKNSLFSSQTPFLEQFKWLIFIYVYLGIFYMVWGSTGAGLHVVKGCLIWVLETEPESSWRTKSCLYIFRSVIWLGELKNFKVIIERLSLFHLLSQISGRT